MQRLHRAIQNAALLAAMARRAHHRVEKSAARLGMQPDRDVLERGHLAEQLEILKGAANAGTCALRRRVARDIARAIMRAPRC